MESERPSSDPESRLTSPVMRPDDSLVWAPLLLFVSLGWLVLSQPLAWSVSRPPTFHNEWIWGGLTSLGLLLLAVFGSARSRKAAARVMYQMAAGLFLLSLAAPVQGYWMNYGRLPWEAMVPVGAAVIVVAQKRRMPWLSAGVVVAAVLLVAGTRFAAP